MIKSERGCLNLQSFATRNSTDMEEDHLVDAELDIESVQMCFYEDGTVPTQAEVTGCIDIEELPFHDELYVLPATVATATVPVAPTTATKHEKISSVKKPRLFATKRLENTVAASKKLAEMTENKNKMKSSYYDKKIAIMEREVKTKEESLFVLRQINNNLEIIANALFLRNDN